MAYSSFVSLSPGGAIILRKNSCFHLEQSPSNPSSAAPVLLFWVRRRAAFLESNARRLFQSVGASSRLRGASLLRVWPCREGFDGMRYQEGVFSLFL